MDVTFGILNELVGDFRLKDAAVEEEGNKVSIFFYLSFWEWRSICWCQFFFQITG